MRYIKKGKEPRSLKQYRSTPNPTYNGYQDKDDLRDNLLKEQGYLCCYCMRRISKQEMKIEHWKPQSKYPQLQLNFNNLLGACKGNEGQPKHLEHCDTSKKDKEIIIDPLNKNCESLILYGTDGRVYSNDTSINEDLDKTLNLNQQTFKNNRIAVIDALYKFLTKRFPAGDWPISFLEKQLSKYSNPIKGEYIPYCQIAVVLLRKKIKIASSKK